MSGTDRARVVLDGVPRVRVYEGGKCCPEDFGLPSVVRAYAKYFGDPYVGCSSTRAFAQEPDWMLGCSYGYGILTSGMAFQQVWHRGEWRYPGELLRMAPDPTAIYRHALEASGYPYEIIGNAAALGARAPRPRPAPASPTSSTAPAPRTRRRSSISNEHWRSSQAAGISLGRCHGDPSVVGALSV